MASILVEETKHGEYYYPASTDEELAKSALQILTANDEYCYCTPDEMFQWTISLAQLIPGADEMGVAELKIEIGKYRDLAKQIPDADAQKIMLDKMERAIKNHNEKQEYKKWYNSMRAVVDNQDWQSVVTYKSGRTVPKSWVLLCERSDYEYENVRLEDLQEVD